MTECKWHILNLNAQLKSLEQLNVAHLYRSTPNVTLFKIVRILPTMQVSFPPLTEMDDL
jgi:hypothetical protein